MPARIATVHEAISRLLRTLGRLHCPRSNLITVRKPGYALFRSARYSKNQAANDRLLAAAMAVYLPSALIIPCI